ncbi:MAG: malate/lactate/ureidoglycolate dehydrogenase [Alphaproteobacteria bacterium]|nr:malate/lactate/ureidoglycolate dehydrogenase [Alphaproteobacteria bacterium]
MPVPALTSFVTSIFAKAGCSPAESDRVARYLVAANLTGHDSHGVVRVPRYVDLIAEGAVVVDQTVAIPFENDSMAVVDGRMGLGQTVGPQAVELGIRKALASGVAVVALRNAGHIGRVGDWAEMAAAKGLISIHFVNGHGSVLVAPFGGAERRFSTAPFCVGVPRTGKPPVVLDFATSLVAEGKVLVASNGGKPVPPDAMIGPDGQLSGDPTTLYGPIEGTHRRDPRFGLGAIRAFGEHKGSGLALMCELLGGALTGNGTAGPLTEGPKDKVRRMRNGMLSVYLAPRFFGSAEEFEAATAVYLDFVKSSKPARAGGEVLVPGEPEQRQRADRTANGVPMPRTTWDSIVAAATKLGVPAPAL